MSGQQPQRGGRGRGRGGRGGRGDENLPFRDRAGGPGGRGDFQSRGPQAGQGGPGGRGDFGGRGRGGSAEKEVFSHGAGHVPQQDSQVRRIENETERASKLKQEPGTTKPPIDPRFPQRPGYGTRGKAITLWANYFELMTPGDLSLFRYSLQILPDEAGKTPTGKKAKRIVELLIDEYFPQHAASIATDYRSNMVCSFELHIDPTQYLVRYRSEGEDEPAQNANTYQIRIQDTGTLQVSDLVDYLTSTQASAVFASKDELLQALNIALGHYPKTASHISSVGANRHFDISAAVPEVADLGAGLKAIRGFFVSVRAATARLLINIQVKNAVFYTEGPLTRLMRAFLNGNSGSLLRLSNFLKKARIRVTHIDKKNKAGDVVLRIKSITGLATPGDGKRLPHPPLVPRYGDGPKDVKFFIDNPDKPQSSVGTSGGKRGGKKPVKEGPKPPPQNNYISVYDFFQTRYGIGWTDLDLPVVNVSTQQNPSYLPAEVCQVLPGQPSAAKLSPTQTQSMIRFAVRRPAQNARSIVTNGARVMGIHPPTNSILREFGISVNPKLITVPGRVLKGPDVKYKKGIATTGFGSWNMRSVQFSTAADVPSWTHLMISSEGSPDAFRSGAELTPVLNAFQAKAREVGINISNYIPGQRIVLSGVDDAEKIEAGIKMFVTSPKRPPPKFLLVILPFVDEVIYSSVKMACDVKYGLRNICVVGSKFAKERNEQYFANVALKLNLKCGGRNQFLDNNRLGLIAEGKTMVVGIDVTHPSPGSSSNAPSVAGIVASVDRWLAQWPADIRIQTAREEMVSDLDTLLKSRLHLWAERNQKQYPQNLLVYRDGVSEGQYDIVLGQELPLLRKACAETYPVTDTKKGLPRISIVIVGKRHNTRFYPTDEAGADRSSNPPNGTVVDRAVTEARNWDFFLQAHAALQGTARPAHYYVILDEIFRGRAVQPPFENAADALEDLTHNLCYLFGRATKAVSICPAAYYADLVCERARRYLRRLFDATPGPTPAASVMEGDGGPGQTADSSDVRIHGNVRDSMFYI